MDKSEIRIKREKQRELEERRRRERVRLDNARRKTNKG